VSVRTIAADTFALVRRRQLPDTHPEHLTHEAMVDAMGDLEHRYPGCGWEAAAMTMDAEVRAARKRSADAAAWRERLAELKADVEVAS
jgi:hypothetical protein